MIQNSFYLLSIMKLFSMICVAVVVVVVIAVLAHQNVFHVCSSKIFDFFIWISEELINKGLVMETSSGLICLLCGYSNYFVDMRRHIEGKHSIGGAYPCPLCDIMCKTENNRRRHVTSVHKKTFSQAQLRLMAEKRSRFGQSNENKWPINSGN